MSDNSELEVIVRDLLRLRFKDSNTKIGKEGLSALCAYLEIFMEEAIGRSELVAKAEPADTVDYDHLQQILLQLLLDF